MGQLLRSLTGKGDKPVFVPIATKLLIGYLVILGFISTVFMILGVQLISNLIVAETQEKVRNDLNSAREIYQNQLEDIYDVVRFTADRYFLRDALLTGQIEQVTANLRAIAENEGLDFLTITDRDGYVLLRSNNVGVVGDFQGNDDLLKTLIEREEPVASTTIIPREELQREAYQLEHQAYIKLVDTPLARPREETNETAGMVLKSAAPIYNYQHNIIGIVYGGILLNRNSEIVDRVKQTVYQDVVYKGKDIGTATIFLDDVRISTNVKQENDARAIGTRVSEDVYNQVFIHGEPWFGRAYVVNDWYITAYEPIRDITNKIIGILYVGMIEQKYQDIRQQTILTFLGITIAGVLFSMGISYYISRRILIPINKLVSASKAVAEGDLEARVDIYTHDELQYLADSFNHMAEALKKRDEKLKEFATRKVMESEKLALIGQLSANVAHELNNPLQGIVAYSHLLLERTPCEDPRTESLEKIVGQANRCRDIIRGLLDFSRQRKPDKTLCNVNYIIQECISLVKNQALFLNIEIVEDFQIDLPMIVADPSQLERVFMNMIINAAEAMDGNGQLVLRTHSTQEDRFVVVEFVDTGTGISEENKEKIFDPFFTTKDVGHGTGLGLAISYGIIKSHKGTISVESEVGKGATFKIGFPLSPVEGNGNGKQG